MKIDEDFMKNFRWITPLMVSLMGIAVTILIFIASNLLTELRALRVEIAETRKFAVDYTDKMVGMVLKMEEKKK